MSKVDGSNIKFFQLRAVVAVVECGSFGKAAAKLEMTQSAISPAIAGLEDKLGVTLFARGRQGATLTPVGEAIFGNVHRILHELEAIARVTQDARGLEVGQVRVAAIRSLATHWLPQVISAFKQRYPKIQVTVMRCVNHGEVRAMLAGGLADVGLMDLGDTQGLTVQPISADDDVARLPPGRQHLPPTLTWQDLQPYALILPVPQDNSYIKLRAYLATLPIALPIAYEVNEDSAIVSMVAEGLGMTMLPYLAAIPIPPQVQVQSLPQRLSRQLAAVTLDAALHPPAVYAFLETVEQMKTAALPYRYN
ncbi:MAG: LysR family transcriptional regulator [Leptolyngbyaceae cyanobacterium T60_A2020_046]|nr:LysR family transcriptional regulator [Leptolyngbyaceae cyanobacterium T60_A2020_046]